MIPRVRRGFVEIKTKDPYMRSFIVATKDGPSRVNVYRNEKNHLFTVATHLDHPKKGRNQLYRKNCTEAQVLEILKNPRLHTGKGYR